MRVFGRRASAVLFNFLRVLGVRRRFLLPANICPIVPITFMKSGMGFQLLDVSLSSLVIDRCRVHDVLSTDGAEIGGVLLCRPYGASADVDAFGSELRAAHPNLILIDDRCLSIPDVGHQGSPWADLTLFSTGYAKVVDIGFGGFGIVRDGHAYARESLHFSATDLARLTRRYKRSVDARQPFEYVDCGWLDTCDLADTADEYVKRVADELTLSLRTKERINAIYSEMIPVEAQFAQEYQGWRFNVRVRRRDAALQHLFAERLFASTHFASLAGVFNSGSAPCAEAAHSNIINLFNDRYYDVDRAARTCEILRRYF
jgi:hypothetical protein